ncbi:putative metal-dependent membrane protease [Oenococcus oeni]|nr:putative metal-dependent membrane protease [Oenococcus oeni]
MDKGIVPYKYDSFSTIALELFCLFVFIVINRFVFKQPIFHSTKNLYRNLLLLLPAYLYLLYGVFSVFENYVLPSNLIIYFLTAITTAISEEYLFRGLILARLLSTSKTTIFPLIVTSLLFGTMHLIHLFDQSFFTTLNQVIQVSFVGFTLGTLYLVTHSIYFPIVLHATLDLVPFILIDTSGGSSDSWMNTFVYSLIYLLIGLAYYLIYRIDRGVKKI